MESARTGRKWALGTEGVFLKKNNGQNPLIVNHLHWQELTGFQMKTLGFQKSKWTPLPRRSATHGMVGTPNWVRMGPVSPACAASDAPHDLQRGVPAVLCRPPATPAPVTHNGCLLRVCGQVQGVIPPLHKWTQPMPNVSQRSAAG